MQGTNSEKIVTVSIIGGGASGLCSIVNFIEEIKKQGKTLVDRNIAFNVRIFDSGHEVGKPFGSGLAYNTEQSETNLMNTPVSLVGLKGYADPHQFMRWLKQNESKWVHLFPEYAKRIHSEESKSSIFVPRKLVGIFLEDLSCGIPQLLKELQVKVKFETMKKEVCDIKQVQSGGSLLKSTDGMQYESDYVILTTGNDDNLICEDLIGKPGYFPYHYRQEKEIEKFIRTYQNPELRVIIMGTRLAGIDAVVLAKKLANLNPNIKLLKMLMASKFAILPMALKDLKLEDTSHLKHFTRENIDSLISKNGGFLTNDEVVKLFDAELTELNGQPTTLDVFLQPAREGQQFQALKQEV